MRTISLITLLIVFVSCGSLPQGRSPRTIDLAASMTEMANQVQNAPSSEARLDITSGRAVFTEVCIHAHLLPGGNIAKTSEFLLYMGRESVSLNDILPKTSEQL